MIENMNNKRRTMALTGVLVVVIMGLLAFIVIANKKTTNYGPTHSMLDHNLDESIVVLESRNTSVGDKGQYQLHVTVPLDFKLTPISAKLVSKKDGADIGTLELKMSDNQASCEMGETEIRNYVKYETAWFSADSTDQKVDSELSLSENYSVELTLNDTEGGQSTTTKEFSRMCFVYVGEGNGFSSDDTGVEPLLEGSNEIEVESTPAPTVSPL